MTNKALSRKSQESDQPLRFLQVFTFYDYYLREFYERCPAFVTASYEDQLEAFIEDGFCGLHILAPHMKNIGYDADIIIANSLPLQLQWANKHGISAYEHSWQEDILRAQINYYKPDILYILNPIQFDSKFLRTVEYKAPLVVGWRAADIPDSTDWSDFDLLLSHLSVCRDRALQLGAKHSEFFHPGVSEEIGRRVEAEPKVYDVVFVGQWTPQHRERNEIITFIENLSERTGFSFGLFLATEPHCLPPKIAARNQGGQWGMDNYKIVRQGRIVVNAEIDMAKGEAGNIRFFEALTCGSFLLTQHQNNISDYLTPGQDLETFSSLEELEFKIAFYLRNHELREKIANNGRSHALRTMSLSKMADKLDEIICRYLNSGNCSIQAQQSDRIEFALRQLELNQVKNALEIIERVSEEASAVRNLEYVRARCLLELGNMHDARISLEREIAFFPDNILARDLLIQVGVYIANSGETMAQTHNTDITVTDIEKALLNARQLFSESRFPEALREINRGKAMKLPIPGLDYLRGLVFLRLQRTGDALEAFREELRYFPDNQACTQELDSLSAQVQRANLVMSDDEFRQIYDRIRPYTMLSPERLWSLFSLGKTICERNLPGNFIECGVAAGGSSALLAYVIAKYSRQTRWLFSFDSFSGMPPSSLIDKHGEIGAEDTGWGTGTCAAPETSLLSICNMLGVSNYVQPVKGLFEDTLPVWKNRVGMISLLHLDGDWYSSTKAILENLYDRIVDGGFLQVDDYGYWEGCRRAIHEFENQRGLHFSLTVLDSTGVSFEKPDRFPLNPVFSPVTIEEFRQDDPVQHGIVSQMSDNERFQLYFSLRNYLSPGQFAKFVEVGSFSGASFLLSYMALRRLFQEVKGWAVEPGGQPQFYEVMHLLSKDAIHVRMLSHPASGLLRREFENDGILPSFIFIDGDHSYEGVKQDIIDYYPLLAPGGLMAFHDFLPALTNENRDAIFFHHANQEPGIRQACIELMENTYRAEHIDVPLLMPTNPTQTQAHLPIIPGVFSTFRLYRKPG